MVMNRKRFVIGACLLWAMALSALADDWTRYVDPRIGSEGLGRVFIGPAAPFGMVRPGPDCTCKPNSGWLPMPEVVTGFAQTHVSGTGGGPKYGNILIQPYIGELEGRNHEQRRISEEMACGYYATTFESGIHTEITAGERCSFYRISWGAGSSRGYEGAPLCLMIDCGFFLGENPIPNAREAQQFVGSEIEIVSETEVRGFSRIRGGWNNGRAYTVYFCLISDTPFAENKTWEDEQGKTGAWLRFSHPSNPINLRVGISFISSLQAKRNIPERSFDEQLAQTRQQWNDLLGRIVIDGNEEQKRMFYTALYHTMLMPSDRTGENPLWNEVRGERREERGERNELRAEKSEEREAMPYYDDFYALWDTYRTSLPLITLIDPDRERDIVKSLIDIGLHDGYMPDARSGNSNGRTQGGSHAEVVVADALAKGLQGIDYEAALQLMLKDADVPPGGNEEQEGRGGLVAYNTLGYVPYGIDRAGTRTVEYAFDDWCIAQVAKTLGHNDLYERFLRQSGNWKNLWRADYEWDGIQGFIMPRSEDGQWLDSVPMRGNEYRGYGGMRNRRYEHKETLAPTTNPLFLYTPIIREGPWYVPWWGTFFYEATSEEYSLSVPHDVEGLIELCGGKEAFRQRLDTFFERGYYNVANEPSFLTPCLYHWIGRPDLSTERVREIVGRHFNDSPTGLPGNDDSGAMSSWLAFHMMGFYPLAGTDRYLLLAPMVKEYTLGRLHVVAKNFSEKGGRVKSIVLNGQKLDRDWISHEELTMGGELVFSLTPDPSPKEEGRRYHLPSHEGNLAPTHPCTHAPSKNALDPSMNISYTLHRQYRTWPLSFAWEGDTLCVGCKEAFYHIARKEVEQANRFCWQQPLDGKTFEANGTFAFISLKAWNELEENGSFVYDGITWNRIDETASPTPPPHDSGTQPMIHVKAVDNPTEMWIAHPNGSEALGTGLPLVVEMHHTPFAVEWRIGRQK